MSSTPKLNYVDYSFPNLVYQLQRNLAEKGTWKDTYRSSTGQMLIELFAAVGSLVLYYIERRAEESYISTAKNYSSVLNLVRLLNYTPRGVVSSKGTLRFTLPKESEDLVFIPQYTQVEDTSGMPYLVRQGGVIISGQLYTDVPGIQGTLVSLEYTSAGRLSQEYSIEGKNIDIETLKISINGIQWEHVTSFVKSTTLSEHYVVRVELDRSITILFGNGVNGKSPSIGSLISITYIKSAGLNGNVYSTGSITTIKDPIYNAKQEAVSISVTNTSTFTGGDDAEDIEDIKYNAPHVFATGDRLVTKSDFIAYISAYPSVADINVWGEAEEPNPNYDNFNRVKICAILQNWVIPDEAFRAGLTASLYEKSLMTVRYTYVDPTILEIIPTLTVKALPGQSLSHIQSKIEEEISKMFILGSTTQLGVDVRHSDIVTVIDNIPGVAYNHTTLKIRKRLIEGYSLEFDWGEVMDALPLLQTGVEIYLNNTRISKDDGDGNWVSTTDEYTVTGTVDYNTGVIGVNISPEVEDPDAVYCRYRQDENGDILTDLNQVCRYINIDYVSLS